MRRFISILISLVIIYGMFFTDFHISEATDKSYTILWKTYYFKDSEHVIIKDNLNFTDGLNNGLALLGKVFKMLFVGGWDLYTSLDDFISLLKVNIFINIILRILLIPVSIVIAMLAMLIALPVYLYKLLFFKAAVSYYLGFCVSFFGLLFISKYIDDSDSKSKQSQTVES
ncbi:hypothetical protein [Anoxybacillus sp. FSL W8-1294]|uniref:hypothetical protein n=1 Tax=Anoxybacillus sp. FSL W8-1294 TaxID=2954655 RepID=UPI0030CB2EE5